MLPLVERALSSPEDVRERILILIDNNLARQAGDELLDPKVNLEEDVGEEVLLSVAKVLHHWVPSAKILDLSMILPKLFPDGLDGQPTD